MHRSLPLALILSSIAAGQEAPAILQVEYENFVSYTGDVADPARLARSATPVPAAVPANFHGNVALADVTRVNGVAAKGVWVIRTQTLLLNPTPTAGAAISDVTRITHTSFSLEILKADGTMLGSVFGMGLSGGTPPPGSPASATAGNLAVVGGTGAFAGARGTYNGIELTGQRTASQAEDPSRRRATPGGRGRLVLQLFPLFRPEIVASEVFHADDTRVTADNPARPGEELNLIATGLGPARSGLGEPFPNDPPAVAVSPVEVLVNDKAAVLIGDAVGVAGTIGRYRVKFRMPEDAAGTAGVRLTAAWAKGLEVSLAVR